MAELDELRVRLEGALEIVEAATASMVATTRALKKGSVSQLVSAISVSESVATRQALEAVQRLASGEPVLARGLERFIAAREALRTATLARGAERGLTSMPFEHVAEALGEYPVLYQGRVLEWRAVVGAALFFVWLTGVTIATRLVFAMFPLALLGAVATFIARAPRLVVTAARIRLGATVVSVKGVESVLVAETLLPRRHVLRFRLRDGGMVEVELPALPKRFVRALEQVTTVERST